MITIESVYSYQTKPEEFIKELVEKCLEGRTTGCITITARNHGSEDENEKRERIAKWIKDNDVTIYGGYDGEPADDWDIEDLLFKFQEYIYYGEHK